MDSTAVIVHMKGNVTVQETTPRNHKHSYPLIRRAHFLHVVQSGDDIHVPRGSSARLVCSSDRSVLLKAGDWRLTPALCGKGEPMPAGTYRALAPRGGRMVSLEGALVLERGTRSTDGGFGVPVLLSPRNTSLLGPRPDILWTAVPGAARYEVELVGPVSFHLFLEAESVRCGMVAGWGETEVCSLPWPTRAPDLPVGSAVFLRVGARRTLVGPLHQEDGASRIYRVSQEKAVEIAEALERLQALPIDSGTRKLLEADLYAREGIIAEASPAYRKALDLQNSPEVQVTLGDAYLAAGLLRLAAGRYEAVQRDSLCPLPLAAAELGLGKIEYVRRNYAAAAAHFRRAREIFISRGLGDEALAAEQRAKESEKADSPQGAAHETS